MEGVGCILAENRISIHIKETHRTEADTALFSEVHRPCVPVTSMNLQRSRSERTRSI